MAGIGGLVFGGRGSRKIHLWMRVLVIGTDLLRLCALGLIPGRAERVLRGCVRRCSILVVPLRMLRVCLVIRGGSAHGWNDRGGEWRLRVVVLFPLLLLTMIGHVYGGMGSGRRNRGSVIGLRIQLAIVLRGSSVTCHALRRDGRDG